MLREDLSTLVSYLSQSAFDFAHVLLCDTERGAAPCIEWPMEGNGWVWSESYHHRAARKVSSSVQFLSQFGADAILQVMSELA